jgi:wobble nucleotide-excising tRNase
MATIATIKTLSGVGILADKAAREEIPPFRRYNLVYGFNGSGKSTLSRVFACLEAGKNDEVLPTDCSFEIALDDGVTFKAPNALGGLENRICVFNGDFIARNLSWQEGRASSIFYISEEQSGLAAELREYQKTVTEKIGSRDAEKKIAAEREKALKSYRTERAKLVAASLHLGNRRYEAGQLEKDYEKLPYDKSSRLEKEMRRVLDIFLAFKVPGSHPLQQKLELLTKKCPDIDAVRIKALDRLIQVESHSDSLDDLISHSSMTIEETRDANAALLELMAASDADHTRAIRKQCKATS